jgi:hypothetical protein
MGCRAQNKKQSELSIMKNTKLSVVLLLLVVVATAISMVGCTTADPANHSNMPWAERPYVGEKPQAPWHGDPFEPVAWNN